MRRPLTLLVAALLVLTALPAASQPAPEPRQRQLVNGEILLPTRFPLGDAERDGWPGLARRAWLCTAESNKAIAEIIDVSPRTWGGTFVIDQIADATGGAEVDVYFYGDFGDCGGTAAPVTLGEFASDGEEVGTVPPGSIKAVVFTPNGVDTRFRYRAFEAPGIPLSGGLDLTVVLGNTVTWTNDTTEFEVVRHTPASGTPAFDSSPKPNSEIPVDGQFSHTFSQVSEFPYETATGTGTITVVDSLD